MAVLAPVPRRRAAGGRQRLGQPAAMARALRWWGRARGRGGDVAVGGRTSVYWAWRRVNREGGSPRAAPRPLPCRRVPSAGEPSARADAANRLNGYLVCALSTSHFVAPCAGAPPASAHPVRAGRRCGRRGPLVPSACVCVMCVGELGAVGRWRGRAGAIGAACTHRLCRWGDGPDVRTSLVPVRPFVFPCTFLRPWVCFYHWGEGSAAAAAACYQTAGLFGVAAALSVAAAAARRALPPGAAALPR